MADNQEDIGQVVSVILEELSALVKRLDGAPDWFNNPDRSLRVAALSKEVEYLCREANLCADLQEARTMVVTARGHLTELQKLLGLH